MTTITDHYRRTVIDSLRIVAEPHCTAPGAWRHVARNNLALLADARGRCQPHAPTDGDVLRMYRAAAARMVRS